MCPICHKVETLTVYPNGKVVLHDPLADLRGHGLQALLRWLVYYALTMDAI